MVSIVFTEKWEMSDVALKIKDSDQLLHVNKAVLAIHSPFFKTHLYSDSFTESKQEVVNVDGIDFWPMLEILRIIHNVDRNWVTAPTLCSVNELVVLYQAGDGYDIPLIRDLCKQQLPKLKPADGLEAAIQFGLHDEKSKILKKMSFEEIQKYLKKGITDLVLSPADAAVIVEKCLQTKKKHKCLSCTLCDDCPSFF